MDLSEFKIQRQACVLPDSLSSALREIKIEINIKNFYTGMKRKIETKENYPNIRDKRRSFSFGFCFYCLTWLQQIHCSFLPLNYWHTFLFKSLFVLGRKVSGFFFFFFSVYLE